MKSSFLLILILCSFFSFGQNTEWAEFYYHATDHYEVSDFVVDNNNNTIQLLIETDYGSLNPLLYQYTDIIKTDSTGNEIWRGRIGGGAVSIDLDSLGNIYILGAFGSSSIDVDPGLGVHTSYSTW